MNPEEPINNNNADSRATRRGFSRMARKVAESAASYDPLKRSQPSRDLRKPFQHTTFNVEQSRQAVQRAEEDWKAARRAELGDCSVKDIRDDFLKEFGNLGEKWCLEFLYGLSQAQLNKLRNLMLGIL